MPATWVMLFITALWRLFKKDLPFLKIRKIDRWPENVPFVSVVVPCYNHGQYLNEAVQSILDQTWQNFEIIVVNDGSTEQNTINILNNFKRPKTRVIHLAQNMGLPAARNAGIKKAQGKYICCLDADDKLHPTYIEKTITAMEVNAGFSFVWSWTQVFGDEDRVWYTPQFDPHNIINYNQLNSPGVFKNSAWGQIGGYQENMREGAEDWEFWIRLTGNGYRGYRISEKLIFVRRIGYSFVHRAKEKMSIIVEKIKSHNPELYKDPKSTMDLIVSRYCDIYSYNAFINLKKRSNYLMTDQPVSLIVSKLGLSGTVNALQTLHRDHNQNTKLIWVSTQALDEKTVDLLFAMTPYVYILPNFLPRYSWNEFIHNLRTQRNVCKVNFLAN